MSLTAEQGKSFYLNWEIENWRFGFARYIKDTQVNGVCLMESDWLRLKSVNLGSLIYRHALKKYCVVSILNIIICHC